jgi:hypothetical protein
MSICGIKLIYFGGPVHQIITVFDLEDICIVGGLKGKGVWFLWKTKVR